MDFKVGDRVRIKIGAVDMGLPHLPAMRCFEGCLGTIKRISEHTGDCRVQTDGNEVCWWWRARALEPVDYSVCIPKPTWRIIVEGDENTSRAKYIMGKKVIKETSAKRYHKDKHSPGMAARALIGKMFPDTAEPDDPPKYFTGKAVCVRPSKRTSFEKGKIYDFSLNDGRGENRYGWTILCSPAKNIEEINLRTDSEFIEIKE